jgi:DNA (cytosine-5)-methyltransferase 1
MGSERLTAVSLFAGVGGFDLAMERNGIDVVAAVEIDPNAQGVLKHRFPNTTIFGDVTTVTGKDLTDAGFVPSRGIITGGFPCQDLSVAGKRAGLAGKRSGLYWEIIRLVEELSPQYLVLENVPGLLSSNGGRDMGTVIGALTQRGYCVGWRVLDAQYFGVAQRRRRVFIVASLGEDGSAPGQVLALEEGLRGDFTSRRKKRKAVAEDAGDSLAIGFSHKNGLDPQPSSDHFPTIRVGVDGAAVCLPALVTMREGKSGGGKGPLVSENISLTLNQTNEQVLIDASNEERSVANCLPAELYHKSTITNQDVNSGHLVVFDPSRRDGARIQEGTVNTLSAFMGTGGNNVPMVAMAFTQNQRDEVRDLGDVAGALQAQPGMKQQTFLAYTNTQEVAGTMTANGIRCDLFKAEKGYLSVGEDELNDATVGPLTARGMSCAKGTETVDSHHYVLEAPSVVYPIDDGREVEKHQNGTGIGEAGAPSYTLDRAQYASVAVPPSTVRRLTPMECERLQGFPDGWTEARVDPVKGLVKQADTARYKQMGNAVAVPVVEWIMKRLVEIY